MRMNGHSHNNKDEFHKHNVEWKKPDKKENNVEGNKTSMAVSVLL